jgi:hypothetical protein
MQKRITSVCGMVYRQESLSGLVKKRKDIIINLGKEEIQFCKRICCSIVHCY